MQKMRIESDSMGEMQVPEAAYYGAQTQRAVLNFPVSDRRFPRPFIRAIGLVKQSAAETNQQMGYLDGALADSIVKAAQEVIDGKLDDQFVVDIYQTGSGTSTNMNTNEVISNRANEMLGQPRGTKKPVHPNDHVNMGQSSNDVIPTAIHVAARESMERQLVPALTQLRDSLAAKAKAFDGIVKIGRTHLQDATPVRLGQEFAGYASMLEHGIKRVQAGSEELAELALGGTAVGTGLNCPPGFPAEVIRRVSEKTGVAFREADDHFEAQGARDAMVFASGALKTVAVSLIKISNDIRWLGSGPRCGFGELRLPAVQPGSSIMPGKVNPVIAESVLQVCAQVIGNDAAITLGGQSGVFELNVMKPVMASNLLESILLLANASKMFAEFCIDGIEADEERCQSFVEQSLAMCTALSPILGYDKAAAIAKDAYKTGRTVREVALEVSGLTAEELTKVLDPDGQTRPGVPGTD
ncbi:MAG TPA: aspartate ammonia-lyase [Verrucomicrobia bacterium]|jgi:fumarate hydratase class II|nr:aspartate ammonia-lyase [Verrucomicrobiota bacterium]